MSKVNEFNKSIDKITERELVYNIVERLKIGEDLNNPDYNNYDTDDINKIIDSESFLLNDIILNMLKTLPIYVLNNMQNIKCSNKIVKTGTKSINFKLPKRSNLIKIIQLSTGHDVTSCIKSEPIIYEDHIEIGMDFDIGLFNDEYFKIYYV